MDIIQQLGTAFGIGLLSGIRLYMTILGIGAAIRFHWIALDPSQNGLAILSDWRVMAVAGVACAIEFVADKVPWVDSMWDSIHTFIRPVGAVILGARAFMHTDPAVQAILAILCGGLALSGHSAKAAARLAVNHSPEPSSNVAMSLAGDAAVPVATWAAFHFPLTTLGFVAAFLLLFGWLGPKVFRAMRFEMVALGSAFARWFGNADFGRPPEVPSEVALPEEFAEALRPLPEEFLSTVRNKTGEPRFEMGVRCAGTDSIPGLNHSIGYLCLTDNDLVFVTKRLMAGRIWKLPLTNLRKAQVSRGLFIDRLWISTIGGEVKFNLLKAPPRVEAPVAMTASAGS